MVGPLPACALCSKYHRGCDSRPGRRCRRCSNQFKDGPIQMAMSMPESEIEEIFQAHGWIRAWTQENGSPDTTKILDVDVKRRTFNQAAGEPVSTTTLELRCKFFGLMSEHNGEFISSLEPQIRQNFSFNLKDSDKSSNLIQTAITIGGYLHLLCSTADIYAFVPESDHRNRLEGEDVQLALSIRWILICQIQTLFNQILSSIRPHDLSTTNACSSATAYTACAILQMEVKYFIDFLKQIPSPRQIPVGLDGPFRRWLVSIETELIQRLTSDCGQFPDWKSVYIGSLKKFPRCHETLSLSVKLQQIGVPPNKAAGAERPAFKIPRDCPPGLMCPVSDRGFSIGSATELGSHGIPQMAVGARYASEFTTGNDSSPIGDFTAKPRQLRQAQNEKLMAAINDYVSSRCEPESYDKKLATEGSRSNAQMDYLSQYESLPIRAPIFDPQMGVIRTLNDSKKRSIGSDIADLTAPYESQPPYKRLKGGGSSKEGSMLSTSPPWRAKTPSRAFGILETGTANEPLDSGYHPDVASDFYPNQMSQLFSSENEMFPELFDDLQPSQFYDPNFSLLNDPFGHPTTNA